MFHILFFALSLISTLPSEHNETKKERNITTDNLHHALIAWSLISAISFATETSSTISKLKTTMTAATTTTKSSSTTTTSTTTNQVQNKRKKNTNKKMIIIKIVPRQNNKRREREICGKRGINLYLVINKKITFQDTMSIEREQRKTEHSSVEHGENEKNTNT